MVQVENVESKTSSCNIYSFRTRNSSSFLGIAGFEGIPQNFVINLVGWLLLHALFIFLRKKAWNYGRMAVLQKDEIRWTDMFYGGYNDGTSMGSKHKYPIIASAISSRHVNNRTATKGVVGVKSDLENARPPPPLQPSPTVNSVDEVEEIPPKRNQNQRDPSVTSGLRVVAQTLTRSKRKSKEKDNKEVDKDNREDNWKEDIKEEEIINLHTGEGDNKSEGDLHLGGSEILVDSESEEEEPVISEIKDTGYFSWIKIVYNLTDEQFMEKCGPDCVFYLSFQRHLIALALIITMSSLFIILPINSHHAFFRNKSYEFSDTTITNLAEDYSYIWAHILLSISYLFISIYIMRRFSRRLQYVEEDDTEMSRTIMIVGLKKKNCQDMLRAHFAEGYPGSTIAEISFVYNISKLQTLEFNRLRASSAKLYFQALLENELRMGQVDETYRPQMRPYLCGVVGCCCRGCGRCKETDAIDYYTEREKNFAEAVEMERKRTINTPVGIVFVTFTSIEYAERLVEDYACTARWFLRTPNSQYSKELNSTTWMVRYAPPPDDINWENLSLDFKMWYLRYILINVALLVLAILFTTPVYFLSSLPQIKVATQSHGNLSAADAPKSTPITSIVEDTLPTIMVWIIGVTMISIVSFSDSVWTGFWTKTAGNLSEMIKVFSFLSFMVILLPAFGLTSVAFIFGGSDIKWSCIFYKDNGALFVNYICTSSLVGTAAELMRLPELFVYAVKLSFARSKAEIGAIRKSVLWEFQIGSNYAWTMLHFAIFTSFSVIYPLVTPFGLLYLIMKHWTDRYNIYFAYAPCKVNKRVHGTAINLVIVCMFMLQFSVLVYVYFHLEDNYHSKTTKEDGEVKVKYEGGNPEVRALQVFSLLGFSITVALFLGQFCFNVCADFSPIHHLKNITNDEEEPEVEEAHPDPNNMVVVTTSQEAQQPRRNSKEKEKEGLKPVVISSASADKMKILKGETAGAGSSPKGKDQQDSQQQQLQLNQNVEAHVTPTHSAAGSQDSKRHPRSESIGSNHSSSRQYGRYIPPLLRPEFLRMGGGRRRRLQQGKSPTPSATGINK